MAALGGKRFGLVAALTLGLGACGLGTEEVTTQSVAPAPVQPVKAEPDCASLKAEIDRLNGQQIPAKFQQAAAKKYTPTQEEWSLFPRYNNLVDAYTVKKCQPALPVQAEQKKPAARKTSTAPAPTKTVALKQPAPAQPTEQKSDVTLSTAPAQPKKPAN